MSSKTNDIRNSSTVQETWIDDPVSHFDGSARAMHALDPDELSALQQAAMRRRFADLRDRIPVLKVMADQQGVDSVEDFDDVVPLLFEHGVYKSFPPALIERGRFDLLTQWLDRLTSHDLGAVSVDDCDSLDSWFATLDDCTPLRVSHSSGTTGAVSFLPRSAHEWGLLGSTLRLEALDAAGRSVNDQVNFDVIWPLHRWGYSAILRGADAYARFLAGDESRFHALTAGRMSADVMFMAGRLRAAAARGELDAVRLSPTMMKRREEFAAMQLEMRDMLPRFLENTTSELAGRRVFIIGTWASLYDLASSALAEGKRQMFAPDSVIFAGGGPKGQVVPTDWEDKVREFAGVDQIQHLYGMSEVMGMNRLCERGRFHVPPWVVPFVLDPDTGAPFPRSGVQSGRAAFLDLMAQSYWGGFVSGDAVTISWDNCPCGRKTPHFARSIVRLSDERGGDDKITCAAAPDAHANALEFLTSGVSSDA
jgi:hypothetical protein